LDEFLDDCDLQKFAEDLEMKNS